MRDVNHIRLIMCDDLDLATLGKEIRIWINLHKLFLFQSLDILCGRKNKIYIVNWLVCVVLVNSEMRSRYNTNYGLI